MWGNADEAAVALRASSPLRAEPPLPTLSPLRGEGCHRKRRVIQTERNRL